MQFKLLILFLFSPILLASTENQEYKLVLEGITQATVSKEKSIDKIIINNPIVSDIDSEYRLILFSVTRLEKEIEDIKVDMVVKNNVVISTQHIQIQINTLFARIEAIKEIISSYKNGLDRSGKYVTPEELSNLSKRIDELGKNIISEGLVNSKIEAVKEAILKNAQDSALTNYFMITGGAIGLLSLLMALIGWILHKLHTAFISKTANDLVAKQTDKWEAEVQQLNSHCSETIIKYKDALIKERAEESFKNGVVYKNLAVSIYSNRFLGGNYSEFIDEKKIVSTNDKRDILCEVIAIQCSAIAQFTKTLDDHSESKALYAESCLDLAYYYCEFKLHRYTLNEATIYKIKRNYSEYGKYQANWLENEKTRYINNVTESDEFSDRMLQFNCSDIIVSLILKRYQIENEDEFLNKLQSDTLEMMSNMDVGVKNTTTLKFNELKDEFKSVFNTYLTPGEVGRI